MLDGLAVAFGAVEEAGVVALDLELEAEEETEGGGVDAAGEGEGARGGTKERSLLAKPMAFLAVSLSSRCSSWVRSLNKFLGETVWALS